MILLSHTYANANFAPVGIPAPLLLRTEMTPLWKMVKFLLQPNEWSAHAPAVVVCHSAFPRELTAVVIGECECCFMDSF